MKSSALVQSWHLAPASCLDKSPVLPVWAGERKFSSRKTWPIHLTGSQQLFLYLASFGSILQGSVQSKRALREPVAQCIRLLLRDKHILSLFPHSWLVLYLYLPFYGLMKREVPNLCACSFTFKRVHAAILSRCTGLIKHCPLLAISSCPMRNCLSIRMSSVNALHLLNSN